jgi:hypothetical protein
MIQKLQARVDSLASQPKEQMQTQKLLSQMQNHHQSLKKRWAAVNKAEQAGQTVSLSPAAQLLKNRIDSRKR